MFPFLMLIAGVGTIALALYVWTRRLKPSVQAFAMLLLAVAQWLICIGGWSLSPSPATAMRWFWFQFPGVAAVPVLFLNYIMQFTGRAQALKARSWVLWVVPLLTQLLALTNALGLHQLMFVDVTFTSANGIMVLRDWQAGPWFLFHSGYSFSIAALGLILMVQTIIGSPGIFRRQMLTLLIAIAPSIFLTILNTFQLLPPDQLVTPMAFVLTGAVIVWAIVRHEMISVVPVARHMLIEQMNDGMLVLDERDRVVDLNPAMQAIIMRQRSQILSLPLQTVLGHLPALLQSVAAAREAPTEVELIHAGQQEYYDVRISPLSYRAQSVGQLIVLRNITRIKHVQAELFQLATTDSLTGLYNRRRFAQLANAQFEQARQQQHPLSLVLFDIDNFKQINDQHGHETGDLVLIAVAEQARIALRPTDIVCRHGGEEFAALLVDTPAATARQLAEQLCERISSQPLVATTRQLRVTISVGTVTRQPGQITTIEELIHVADQLMYQAKQSGRNRVMFE